MRDNGTENGGGVTQGGSRALALLSACGLGSDEEGGLPRLREQISGRPGGAISGRN
jgi:hypothetical protein